MRFLTKTTGDVPPLNVSINTDLMILSERRSLHSVAGEFNYVESLESLARVGVDQRGSADQCRTVTTPEGPRV